MRRANLRGFTLIGVVVALFILALGFGYYAQSLVSNRKVIKKLEQSNVAENYAAELTETFLSLSSSQLAGYLSAVPAVPGTPAYPLCAHINLIDRAASSGSTPTFMNRDPMADLPPLSFIENSQSAKFAANRFYQVQVVDLATLAVNAAACGKSTATGGTCGVIGGTYVLCPNERFLVTVGVSFVPTGKDEKSVQRIVVSSVLPEA